MNMLLSIITIFLKIIILTSVVISGIILILWIFAVTANFQRQIDFSGQIFLIILWIPSLILTSIIIIIYVVTSKFSEFRFILPSLFLSLVLVDFSLYLSFLLIRVINSYTNGWLTESFIVCLGRGCLRLTLRWEFQSC